MSILYERKAMKIERKRKGKGKKKLQTNMAPAPRFQMTHTLAWIQSIASRFQRDQNRVVSSLLS